jgi:predicted ArsR family transcriptional regulator
VEEWVPDDPLARVAGLTQPIRRTLYRLVVAEPGGVSAPRAAEATGLRRSTASYHLDKLVEHGLVTVRYERLTGRQGPGAGRPAKIYETGVRAVEISVPPRDYQSVGELMAAAIEQDPATSFEPLLHLASEHGRQLWRQHTSTEPTEATWSAVAAVLRGCGYEPAEERRELELRNGPYDALARAHREIICPMNLAIVRGVLDEAAMTDRAAVLSVDASRCCVLITAAPQDAANDARDGDARG